MRVLIIDDSPLIRKMVERALRQSGIELEQVLHAGDGEQALATLRSAALTAEPLNLIFSDINMPIMDGLEFLERRLQEGLATGVPVIIITTEGSAETVARATAAGVRGYICKPFQPEQFQATMQAVARSLPVTNAA